METKLSDKIGMWLTALLLIGCVALWCYFAYLAQDQEFINAHPAKKNCDTSELQISGYCCKNVEQFNSGNCTI